MHKLWFQLQCWWYGYNPKFVREVLEADAMPAAARFDNIDDLLAWLDKD